MSFFRVPAASLIGIIMAGCSPQFNIGAADFPAWLACGLSFKLLDLGAAFFNGRLQLTPSFADKLRLVGAPFLARNNPNPQNHQN
jgi:hypothetical protein